MLDDLKANNRAWAEGKTRTDPNFFNRLVGQQSPAYLWIGCSDSRVPANEIVGLDPGEMFVHRNVANLAPPQDANYLSVLQYAVDILRVRHILVVGHHGCGGVRTAIDGTTTHGLIDHWLSPIRDTAFENHEELAPLDMDARVDRMVELNVLRQVRQVGSNPFVTAAWAREQPLCVHGWVYSLETGLVSDLDVSVDGPDEFRARFLNQS